MRFVNFDFDDKGRWEYTQGGTWAWPHIKHEGKWIGGLGYNLYTFIDDKLEYGIIEGLFEELEEVKTILARKTCRSLSNFIFDEFLDYDNYDLTQTEEYLEEYIETQQEIADCLCKSNLDFENWQEICEYLCDNLY